MKQTGECILGDSAPQVGKCVRCPSFDCMVLVDTASVDGPKIVRQQPEGYNLCMNTRRDVVLQVNDLETQVKPS